MNRQLDLLKRPVTPTAYLRELLAVRGSRSRSDHRLVADIGMQATKNPRVGILIRDMHRRGVRRFVRIVGPESGYSQGELKRMAAFVIALFHGLGALHSMDPKMVSWEDQLQLLGTMLEHAPKRNSK